MSLARPHNIQISVRLIIAALLHAAYLYFVYEYKWFGVRGQTEPLMLIAATCSVGIVAAAPVIWIGDAVEKVIAAALLLSPFCWMWHVVHSISKLWTG